MITPEVEFECEHIAYAMQALLGNIPREIGRAAIRTSRHMRSVTLYLAAAAPLPDPELVDDIAVEMEALSEGPVHIDVELWVSSDWRSVGWPGQDARLIFHRWVPGQTPFPLRAPLPDRTAGPERRPDVSDPLRFERRQFSHAVDALLGNITPEMCRISVDTDHRLSTAVLHISATAAPPDDIVEAIEARMRARADTHVRIEVQVWIDEDWMSADWPGYHARQIFCRWSPLPEWDDEE